MKKSSAVLIVIMVASFVLSVVLFFASMAMTVGSGIVSVINGTAYEEIKEAGYGIDVSEKDGVRVDIPGIHVLVDDKGVDVKVIGIHVDLRDEDGNETNGTKDTASVEEKAG